MNGCSAKPSACNGASMPNRRSVGSTSTDCVNASTTNPDRRRCGSGSRTIKGAWKDSSRWPTLEQPVIATHLAVVAGEDHQCRFGQTRSVQIAEQPGQLIVDLLWAPW